jgi:hypothetical protein
VSAVPPMMGCPWASTNPGNSILSAKVWSIVYGDLSSHGLRSSRVPTDNTRPSRTATAVPAGQPGSMVTIFLATNTVIAPLS